LTRAGVHTVLRRARIVWKRARASIRSPDPDYDAKLIDVAAAVAAAKAQPGSVVTVYLDEVTVERQPTVAHCVCAQADRPSKLGRCAARNRIR
jgi:hypothetical protein